MIPKITIEGVFFKELISHQDERGYFRELIRFTDDFFKEGFGQLSQSLVNTGVVKAWHLHRKQTQWTSIIIGKAKVALHDCRSDSPTYRNTIEFMVGENNAQVVYSFPPGVAHGYKCLEGPMLVLYITSGVYDLQDEWRMAEDDKKINFNWNF